MEVLATDDDDRSKGNGPSFTFRMDPNAQDVIRASFKVNSEHFRTWKLQINNLKRNREIVENVEKKQCVVHF